MPSSMTHTYFSLDVYHQLPVRCQNRIKESMESFKLFSQGSDPFMFYHFLVGKRAKYAMKIQKEMHTLHTREYFIHVIQYIHKNNLVHHSESMAFLYGYICHYFLDMYAHPFIYYKSGLFDKKKKDTYVYNGLHQKLEYNIDLYMVKMREKQIPSHYKIYENIFSFSDLSEPVYQLIDESIYRTYHYKNAAKLYVSSVRYMKKFFKYVNHDPSGFKLKLYQIVDKVTPNHFIRLSELSYHHDFEDNLSYLNLDHHKWCYPWDNKKMFTTSFFDLYDKALRDSIGTISKVTDILDKDKLDIEALNSLFLDLSFTTGLPCDMKVEMKYFDV